LHDLIPIDAVLPGALTTAEIDATMAYAEAEKALATRQAYASDWPRDFAAMVRLQRRYSPCRRMSASSSPPIYPASLIAAANRPQGGRDRLPAQAGWTRAADQPGGGEGGPARHPPHHRRREEGARRRPRRT
jgi:hypothetical protein